MICKNYTQKNIVLYAYFVSKFHFKVTGTDLLGYQNLVVTQ